MTEMQFNEIKERLADWRSERSLTYENQREEFLGNVFEKVSEYFRAKDDLERVEALCDIAAFFFNAFELKFGAFSNIKRAGMIHLIDHFTSYFLEHNNKTVYNKCMLEKIKEIESRTGFYDERLKKFVDTICAFSKDEALSNVSKDFGFLGNSIIYKLTQEDKNFWFITCKEIETNLQIDYKVKKIYKANYKSYRL